ncbi:hypothetical protein HanRHA438_Chr17g0823021 [Helianthus annuus]|nr:hypothetical protein HanRHA438_Chr17g0823021 [Helianthus annuus]
MLKHREHEICSKICRMSVRLAVRLRCSVNYDGSRNGRKNGLTCATNEFLTRQSLKHNILMIT